MTPETESVPALRARLAQLEAERKEAFRIVLEANHGGPEDIRDEEYLGAISELADWVKKREPQLEAEIVALKAKMVDGASPLNLALDQAWAEKQRADAAEAKAAQLEAQAEQMRQALEGIRECPYTIDSASVPMAGIAANPEQVVGTLHLAMVKRAKVLAALSSDAGRSLLEAVRLAHGALDECHGVLSTLLNRDKDGPPIEQRPPYCALGELGAYVRKAANMAETALDGVAPWVSGTEGGKR